MERATIRPQVGIDILSAYDQIILLRRYLATIALYAKEIDDWAYTFTYYGNCYEWEPGFRPRLLGNLEEDEAWLRSFEILDQGFRHLQKDVNS